MPPTRLVYPHYTGCQILSTQGGPDNNYVIIKGFRWLFTQSRVYLGGRCVHSFYLRSFQVLQLLFKIPAFKSELSHRVPPSKYGVPIIELAGRFWELIYCPRGF